MELLLITILSNAVSDFFIQGGDVAKGRKSDDKLKVLKSNVIHFTQTFGTLILLITMFFLQGHNLLNLILYATIISSIHIIIDIIKCYIEKNYFKKSKIKTILFIVDQVCHLIAIVLVANVYTDIIKYNHILDELIPNLDKDVYYSILINVIIILYVVKGGVYLIDTILNEINPKEKDIQDNKMIENNTTPETAMGKINDNEDNNNEDNNNEDKDNNNELGLYQSLSAYIGMLERFLTIIFVVNNQYNALGFLLTAKSMVRAEKIRDDEDFGTEFLIGTFLSVSIAVLGGVLIKFISSEHVLNIII